MRTLRIIAMAALASALWLTIAIPIAWAAPQTKSTSTVHVREYTRKDGTVVAAHERTAPTTATSNASASVHIPTTPTTVRSSSTAVPAADNVSAIKHTSPTPPKGTAALPITPPQQSTQKTVHVRQYTRKDGTVVAAHERRAPATPRTLSARPANPTPAPSLSTTAPATSSALPTAHASQPPPKAIAVGSPRTSGITTTSTTTNGQPTYIGPRGGEYHYSASGKKVYSKKKE